MRTPEEKIKEAILHPDVEIRSRALGYFANAYSSDPTLMPLVVRAVETYGREDADHFIGHTPSLRQTEETLAWVVRQLNDPAIEESESFPLDLSLILLSADPALLAPLESAILAAPYFEPDWKPRFTDRLRMQSWDVATCWQRLEAFCVKGNGKAYFDEFELDHGYDIAEVLARSGQECEDRVRDILSKEAEHDDLPAQWMEPIVIRLAGLARLESAVPLLVSKLGVDDDLVPHETAQALIRIGTPAVLEAVTQVFPTEETDFNYSALEPLEHIHSDLAVEKVLHLLGKASDLSLRRQLARALLWQFAPEGIDVARELLAGEVRRDFESRFLKHALLDACTISGERFPEYDAWVAEVKAEREEYKRQMWHFGAPDDEEEYLPPPPIVPRLGLRPVQAAAPKVGRNDPCPCGSGKKFKKCCLK